mmetsp:Transcript_14879/g.17709  ORF Transcript_14879/g.17709 Transcript_14879/m.17709 type:complete len:97 (+) Transcript_14879:123-413(+)
MWPDIYFSADSNALLCLEGDTPTTFKMSDYKMSNPTTSWWCGKNVAYKFCLDLACEKFLSGAGSLYNYYILEYEDLVVKVQLWPYDPFTLGGVTMF